MAQHEAATMALFHPFYHKPTKGVADCCGGRAWRVWGGSEGLRIVYKWGGWGEVGRVMAALLCRDILEC